ncbi:MAG TPA: redox-sensitive transcriptional activator SoxR, partial [Acidimicrobiales bacterium]|nr:redox-sensitive transcriptional activator SoxR [Acidimicrobiales bacterium]
MFLSIGEVADRAAVATSALRFYEREGLITATRSPGGQRRFHRDVLRRIAFIRAAQRVGLTLDEIRDALTSLPDSRTPTAADWERLSRSWRPLLDRRIA